MRRIAHQLAWLTLAAATLAAAVAGRLASAQQPAARQPVRGAARPEVPQDEDGDPDDHDNAIVQQQRQQRAALMNQIAAYQQFFNRQVFGGRIQEEEFARRQIESVLAKYIDHLDRSCGLSDSQRKKLHAAVQGDIKRFFDGVAEARKVVDKVDDPRGLLQAIKKATAPLAAERTALQAGEGPIFTKATRHILTPEQLAGYEKDARDRLVFRHRAAVRWTAVMLARSLGLTDDRRRRLESLLLEETRPPNKFGNFDYTIVMYQAARIPQARIRPIFDDVQWRVMEQEFAAIRRWEFQLKQGGFLPAEMFDDRRDGAVRAIHPPETTETNIPALARILPMRR